MTAHATAHAHQPQKWPSIERYVERVTYRIGAPPLFRLKPGVNANAAKQTFDEISSLWHGHSVDLYAGLITVWPLA